MNAMYSPEVRERVINTLLGEARGEGPLGLQAVAEVIRNRMRSGRFPNDPAAVVNQPGQFLGNYPGSPEQRQRAGSIFDLVFSPAYAHNLTGGATHYWAPAGMEGGRDPYWASDEMRKQNAKKSRLGGHVFLSPGEPSPARFGRQQPRMDTGPMDRSGMPLPYTPNVYDNMNVPVPTPASNVVPVPTSRPSRPVPIGTDFPAVPPQVSPNPVQPRLPSPAPQGSPILPVANVARPTPRPRPTGALGLGNNVGNAFASGDISRASPFDLHSILASHQGAGHIDSLDPAFRTSLANMIAGAPADIRDQLGILSGYRDVAHQQRLWNNALKKYGSPEAARKWVAPPGRSFHNKGRAVDLTYGNDAARDWVHANAANYGLNFPLGNEPWHIEPMGSRSGKTSRLARQVQPHNPHATPSAGGKLSGGSRMASASAKGRGNTGKGFLANLFGGGGGKNPFAGLGSMFGDMAEMEYEPLPRLNVPQNTLMAGGIVPTTQPLRRRV